MLELEFPSYIYLKKKSECWYSANRTTYHEIEILDSKFHCWAIFQLNSVSCILSQQQTHPRHQEHIQNTRVPIYNVTNPHYYNSYTRIKLAYFYAAPDEGTRTPILS